MFLHGAGERGSDLEKVKIHGPPRLVEGKEDFPFVVASPQVEAGRNFDGDALIALLDEVVRQLPVDEDRIYLTGLSMGGYALAIRPASMLSCAHSRKPPSNYALERTRER